MRWFQNVPALIFGLGCGLACTAAQNDPALNVLVYSGVAPEILVQAEADSSKILERAGVRLNWRNCRPEDPCPIAPDFVHVSMRIVNHTGGEGLGCSLVTNAGGADAAASLENVQRLARASGILAWQILAAVMAHEIGHLMLGPSHSGSGLMHGNWDVHDLGHLGQRQLKFDLAQSTRLKAAVLARSRPERTLLAARRP